MTLIYIKLVLAVTFMKYLASVVFLIFLPAIKFTESCGDGGKWTYKEYFQKKLPIFFFLSNLSLLIVNTSGAYN